MRRFFRFGLNVVLVLSAIGVMRGAEPVALVELKSAGWPQPDGPRMGGFAGVSGGALIFGGGVMAEGAAARTDVSVLGLNPRADWLNQPVVESPAWAASAQANNAVAIAGGIRGGVFSKEVTLLSWRAGQPAMVPLPELPRPVAGAGAAVIGNKSYVVGGLASLKAASALWLLGLSAPEKGSQELEPLPSKGKVLPIVTAQYDVLHVFGRREVVKDTAGRQTRDLAGLTVFTPQRKGWLGESAT